MQVTRQSRVRPVGVILSKVTDNDWVSWRKPLEWTGDQLRNPFPVHHSHNQEHTALLVIKCITMSSVNKLRFTSKVVLNFFTVIQWKCPKIITFLITSLMSLSWRQQQDQFIFIYLILTPKTRFQGWPSGIPVTVPVGQRCFWIFALQFPVFTPVCLSGRHF